MPRKLLSSLLHRAGNRFKAVGDYVDDIGAGRPSGVQNLRTATDHQEIAPANEDLTERSSADVVTTKRKHEDEVVNQIIDVQSLDSAECGSPQRSALRFKSNSPQLVQIPGPDGNLTAIAMTEEMFKQLGDLIRNRRLVDLLGRRLDQQAAKVSEEDGACVQTIEGFKQLLETLQANIDRTEEPSEELLEEFRLNDRALKMAQQDHERLMAKGKALDDEEFRAFKHHMRIGQQLERAFETALVSNGHLEPREDLEGTPPASEAVPTHHEERVGLERFYTESFIARRGRPDNQHEESEVGNNRRQGEGSFEKQEGSIFTHGVRYDFETAKYTLDKAERELATYNEQMKPAENFEGYRDFIKTTEGVEVTREDFAKHQYGLLQKYTHNVVEAEANYQKAKAAAKEAGKDLRECESVMSDWSGDGYLWDTDPVARKKFMASINRIPVLTWLENLERLTEQEEADGCYRTDVEKEQMASADSQAEDVEMALDPIEASKPFLSLSMTAGAGDGWWTRRQCEQRRKLIQAWNKQVGHY